MPSIQAMASRIVSAAWFSSTTWLIAAGTCTHCKDHQRPSGSASTVYTGFPNRHSSSPVFWSYESSLRRAQMKQGRSGAVSSGTGQREFGTYRPTGGFVWGLLHGSCGTWGIPSAGAGALLGSVLEALVGSAAGLPDGMSPSWVAAVAVAQEHGALFFSGLGPVQSCDKVFLTKARWTRLSSKSSTQRTASHSNSDRCQRRIDA